MLQQLEQRLNDLRRDFEEYKRKNEYPEKDTEFWYISDYGNIDNAFWSGNDGQKFQYDIGNFFKTKEEARNCLEAIKTKAELRKLAKELNNGVEIDWNCAMQDKYYIFFNHQVNDLEIEYVSLCQDVAPVFCLNSNFLDKAKERIGEERLIQLIKAGV